MLSGASTAPAYVPEAYNCFVCRHFGEDVGAAIRCDHPQWGRLHGTPKTGCCDWEREPGAEG